MFCSCFQSPLFLMLAFSFVGFSCFCFLIYFFLFLFYESSFNVLVIVSVVLGFLGFVMCHLLDLFVFFGGGCFLGRVFKGQVRWPKGPPHLALNPPYLFSFVFGLFVFCWLLFFSFVFAFGFLEGFKGQVRWPKGAPHLALNPPY